ncbi:hypothetical protein OROMI_002406 [Orobanche minor]
MTLYLSMDYFVGRHLAESSSSSVCHLQIISTYDLGLLFHMFFLARYCKLLEENSFCGVYVWSKQNPYIHMNFLGLFTFTTAYLPWVLLGFSILVGENAWVDLLGMIAGQSYYFLEEVYPRMTGRRPLRTLDIIRSLFADEPVVAARPANIRFAAPPVDDARWN